MSASGGEESCAICRKPFEPSQARFRNGQRDLHLACLDQTSAPTGRRTVLVVDDEIEMRGVLREILAPRAYAVLDTGNPEEALRIAREYAGPIHVLLTDVVMPGIEGPELAKLMGPLRVQMRILFMSAFEAVHRLKPGAIFLSKPFTVQELMAKLAEGVEGGTDRATGTSSEPA